MSAWLMTGWLAYFCACRFRYRLSGGRAVANRALVRQTYLWVLTSCDAFNWGLIVGYFAQRLKSGNLC